MQQRMNALSSNMMEFMRDLHFRYCRQASKQVLALPEVKMAPREVFMSALHLRATTSRMRNRIVAGCSTTGRFRSDAIGLANNKPMAAPFLALRRTWRRSAKADAV